MRPVDEYRQQLPPHLRGARSVDAEKTRRMPIVPRTSGSFLPMDPYEGTKREFSNQAATKKTAKGKVEYNTPPLLVGGALAFGTAFLLGGLIFGIHPEMTSGVVPVQLAPDILGAIIETYATINLFGNISARRRQRQAAKGN